MTRTKTTKFHRGEAYQERGHAEFWSAGYWYWYWVDEPPAAMATRQWSLRDDEQVRKNNERAASFQTKLRII